MAKVIAICCYGFLACMLVGVRLFISRKAPSSNHLNSLNRTSSFSVIYLTVQECCSVKWVGRTTIRVDTFRDQVG